MRALLIGSPGRAPFTGHFRGRWVGAGAELHWAGRLRAGASPEEGWAAAEAARDALAAMSGADRYALVDAAWAALRPLPHADLSILLVARDADGVVVAGSGLTEVRGDGRPVAPPNHPLYDDPGIRDRAGYLHLDAPAEEYVAVPVGGRWPTDNLAAACGLRSL